MILLYLVNMGLHLHFQQFQMDDFFFYLKIFLSFHLTKINNLVHKL